MQIKLIKINRFTLNAENKLSTKKIESLFGRSGMSNSSNLTTVRERREKSMKFASSIRKPKLKTDPTSEEFEEERFVGFDNKQYMLENQKIKMLFG